MCVCVAVKICEGSSMLKKKKKVKLRKTEPKYNTVVHTNMYMLPDI